MRNFHKSICDTTGDINILEFSRTEVTDNETYLRLCRARPYEEPDDLVFYLLDGEYGKLSFWHQYIGEFLTEDYIKNNIKLYWSLIELDDKVYCVDGPFYLATPALPGFIADGKSLEEHIRIVDSDTVLLEALYDGVSDAYELGHWMEVDFEYTENGWRISGGEGAEQFMRFASVRDIENPETGDCVTLIIACLAVSMLGVGLTVKKHRHLNIV
jgi:hypothetical protein